MMLQLIVALSTCGMSSAAAQAFPPVVHSLYHSPGAWSWYSTQYTRPSWPATVPTWTPSVYTSETWPSAVWSEPSYSSAPPASPYTPPSPAPTWSTSWSAWDQPGYSSSWSTINNPPHAWSSEGSAWHSWPTTFETSHGWHSTSAWPAPAPSPTLPSLNDALIAAGAAQFAALIQSDPVVSAAYAADVPTVFAPTDQYIGSTFNTSGLRRRATLTPAEQQQLLLHASQNQSEINGLRTPPGTVVSTKDSTANLNGQTQKVVSDPRNQTNSTNTKRWLPAILPRQDNSSSVPTQVNIFSGLGNSIGILTADIPYAGGVIHTTNGLFTVPLSLSSTAALTGETTFVSLTNTSGQTLGLDATPLITVFIPTNDAFAAAGVSTSSAGLASAISGHVVQGFAGYIPSLTNGSSFVTQAGTTITVTIQGEDYFINNAKIVSSNLILENGVAHVIDSVLTLPVAPYTGAAAPSFVHTDVTKSLGLLLGVAIFLAWSL
ncbi:hypothetical protein PV04_01422 [Phialophora macrospora]|uniref:FAS1 domain-containing protein n=1 Tax=Phialophora macrospora TaxID=1851006 RepID=A0A0D2G378_9EURO|nr:hypothetical protein PV04_01422 [Phialophora macrospora]